MNKETTLEFVKNNDTGEKYCRKVFEERFEKSFPKKCPTWLRDPKSGNLLELDGFNEELKIAFEYDGPKHYKIHNCFYEIRKGLEDQIETGVIKNNLCEQNGIKLIRIDSVDCEKQEKAKKLIIKQIELMV